jgi:hypothetical protein
MYTSHIGRRFVQIYNERMNTDLQPKQFFLEQVFPKFYKHPKYFKWIVNSPIVQALKKEEKEQLKTFDEQQEFRLAKLQTRIDTEEVDMSFAIGFPPANQNFDTSGQVTNIPIVADEQEIYASWIGAGFGIEVEGGQVWLIDEPELFWTIFEGWETYRIFLNSEVMDLKGNDISIWNGIWLDFKLTSEQASPKFMIDKYVKQSKGRYFLISRNWYEMMFLFAETFLNHRMKLYSASYIAKKQKYITLGFTQLDLPEATRFYKELFGNISPEQRERVKNLYRTRYGFLVAFERFSVIGLKALEPSDMRNYLQEIELDTIDYKNDEQSQFLHKIYKTWICAMLNNEELIKRAEDFAQTLFRFYSQSEYKTTNERGQMVRDTLAAHGRISLLECLANLSVADAIYAGYCKELTDELTRVLPRDETYYFVLLTKINYYAIKANISQ